MTASVWAPGSTNVPSVDPASQLLSQSFVATEGQTDFVITQFIYSINSGALTIYVNRAKLDHQYVTELSTTTFRIPACEVGDDVEVVGNVAIDDPSLYADAAAASAAEALGYKNQAEGFNNDAQASAVAAASSESSAAANANAAATSESNALTYKNAAETAKNTAVSAKDTAVTASNTAVAAASDPNVVVVGQDLLEPVSEIETVASNIGNVNVVGANITTVNATGGNIANVNTVATNIASVNTVGSNITSVNTVGNNITAVNTCSTNIAAIIAAPAQAASAATSAVDAQSSEDAAAAYAASINPADLVHKSGTETISGSKTFGVEVVLGYGTINRIPYLNSLKKLITSDALTFDGSNLGLGVTPSTWGGGYKVIQNAAGFYGNYQTSTMLIGQNWYDSGAGYYKYIASAQASYYSQASGSHAWFTAPYGTAGNAISFTQAMTLDASGNLRIGAIAALLGTERLTVASALSDTAAAFQQASGITMAIGADSTGAYSGSVTNQPYVLRTSNTERMRIDSSGNLLVGTTSNINNAKFIVDGGSQTTAQFYRGSTAASSQIYFSNGNGVVGQVYTEGSNTVYATSSDYRLKENIQPMQNALDVVAQLNPVTFTWKADGSDGQSFIAHELQAIMPDCVTGEKDAVDAEGNPVYQGIDTSFLVPTLTKAIKELKAEVDSLKAQLNPT